MNDKYFNKIGLRVTNSKPQTLPEKSGQAVANEGEPGINEPHIN